jgi:uncharacterized protein DUF4058
MPSPFPGMNPYLEHPSVWHDFHQSFIPAAREALTPQVTPRYFVRVEEHVYLRDPEDDGKILLGQSDVDVGLTLPPKRDDAAVALLSAPVQIDMPELDELRLDYLEVLTVNDRKLVTVIELLSPANKDAGPHRDRYLRKRQELIANGVNFVELDLLRGGPRLPPVNRTKCDYYALVCRTVRRPKADVWPIALRDPLPPIPIPLAPGDREAELNVGAVLNRVYDGAGYAHTIYEHQPIPRLSPADAVWAEEIVRAAAK